MRFLFILLFIVKFSFSQNNDSYSAYSYFQSGEYEKAVDIYKKISRGSNFHVYYNPYFQSLLKIQDYKIAKTLVNRMVRKYPYQLTYLVDLYIVENKLDKKESEQIIHRIYDKLLNHGNQVVSIANSFIRYQKYEEALLCYLKLREINYNQSFYLQVAQLYQYMDDDEKMIEEYMMSLKDDPKRKNLIITFLQRYLDNSGIYNENNYQIVKESLLRNSAQEKDSYIFSELLIWYFLQVNNFNLSFIQAKALDKRLGEDGERIYILAETFLDNQYYDLAIKAYDYIISKGDDTYYYIDANINKLFAMGKLEDSDLYEIDQLYNKSINKLGFNTNTIRLINNYAQFKAFSLGELSEALTILDEAMSISNLSRYDLSECKFVYADVMLLSGNIWNSLLYYSQIEKDFKESSTGHEARLRKAKVFYYIGDFQWAQSQLDVLKSSTSKLIANDAMLLSLLITDNLNLDTSDVPMKTYARADLLYYQNDFEKAHLTLDSVLLSYPFHTLVDEIYFRKYIMYYKNKDIENSILMLNEIINRYSTGILYDDAIFNLARLYEDHGDFEKATLYYEMVLFECPGSIFVVESRKRYRNLRGDNL